MYMLHNRLRNTYTEVSLNQSQLYCNEAPGHETGLRDGLQVSSLSTLQLHKLLLQELLLLVHGFKGLLRSLGLVCLRLGAKAA